MVGNPLRILSFEEAASPPFQRNDSEAERVVDTIIVDVRNRGEKAVRAWAEKLSECESGEKIFLARSELEESWASLDASTRGLLERTQGRIEAFADSQKACLSKLDMPVPGGRAGHDLIPVASAGCYVPGGRHPLPSSALMSVTPARSAGVGEIYCAGPHPAPVTLAAAFLAGADGFLKVGGAQAVAALAFGVFTKPCAMVVGPGGRFVAAAKRRLFGMVGTEAPAGPSELLVIADEYADPEIVAADILAVAEHDIAALPLLVCLSENAQNRIEASLGMALEKLPEPNASTARQALELGWSCVAKDPLQACRIAEAWAPEHLSLSVENARWFMERIDSAGAVFLGGNSGEVFGDYGMGPNHTLPTSGAARFSGGLSVFDFLRVRTWLKIDNPSTCAADAVAFAELEGLNAHARAARLRARQPGRDQKP